MKQRLITILAILASTGSVFAQQPSVPKPGLEIDLPEVVAEVRWLTTATTTPSIREQLPF
jgi:hypothetical protein